MLNLRYITALSPLEIIVHVLWALGCLIGLTTILWGFGLIYAVICAANGTYPGLILESIHYWWIGLGSIFYFLKFTPIIAYSPVLRPRLHEDFGQTQF